jgi:hydroxypyruvate reductase
MIIMNHLDNLVKMYWEAVRTVDPGMLITSYVKKENGKLIIKNPGTIISEDLSRYKQIIVCGIGKAAARMAAAIEQVLGDDIAHGLVITKYGHTVKTKKIKVMEAGHPLPDENSVRGAKVLTQMAREADEETLVINLISGGGSALFCLPAGALTLADKIQTTKLLLACGADIDEMNCVRKHLSRVKGGGLARIAYPARLINLILSDVISDRIDTIASGITAPDPTTFADALAIARKYSLEDKLSPAVMEHLLQGTKGLIPETPKENDSAFKKTVNIILGNNKLACQAALREAKNLGYEARVLTTTLTGEASEAGVMFAQRAKELITDKTGETKNSLLINGGETTVTIQGEGKGGRNQEMALAFACELNRIQPGARNVYFLSAGTDGSDGPTDAAGAFVTPELIEEMKNIAATAEAHLARNDSYNFFAKTGCLFKTGPTYTNVCDIQILLVV